jgi:hypothetical protein
MPTKSLTNATEVQTEHQNGNGKLSPQDIERLFGDGYREVEILSDGTIPREAPRNGDAVDEAVTRTLKTERTWY